jgi:hypothetical protein
MTAMLAVLITLFLTPTPTSPRDETVLVNEMAKLTVKYDHGALSILRVERLPLPSPQRMRRWRGRFEARAVGGGKTIDFVRFDFPLMAEAEAPEDVTDEARQLATKLREHVTATAVVRTPLPAGATSFTIYDTVTKKSASADLPAPSGAAAAPPAAAGAGSTKR